MCDSSNHLQDVTRFWDTDIMLYFPFRDALIKEGDGDKTEVRISGIYVDAEVHYKQTYQTDLYIQSLLY